MRSTTLLAVLVIALFGCDGGSPADVPGDVPGDHASEPDTAPVEDTASTDRVVPEPIAPARQLRQDGWLRGDLHMHTLWSDGDDAVGIVVALAEYLSEQEFLSFHPDFEDGHLDFIAITDHHVTAVATDPEFSSDTLILIPGQELGGPGHANLWPLTEAISYDPGGDGVTLEDYQAAADAVHAQGSLFSVNHPMDPGLEFAWDLRDPDSVEVWNAGWALGSPAYLPEDLAAWEASHGPASPVFRKAALLPGMTGCGQALAFYQAQLTRGIHPAVVGGSDRHAFFPVGWPTTWAQAGTADAAGVMDAVRARRTFVSRTPLGPTLDVRVTVDGVVHPLGAAVTIPGAGEDADLVIRVGGAAGGVLRVIQGREVDSDASLQDADLAPVTVEIPITEDDQTIHLGIGVEPGDWLLPVVWDSLVAPGLDAAHAAMVPGMAHAAVTTSSSDYMGLAGIFGEVLDVYLITPELCDPLSWVPGNLHCMTADPHGIATYFLPDWVTRPLNVIVRDGQLTDYTMGAVGSAIVFTD